MELKRQVEVRMPTKFGEFNMVAYSEDENDHFPHFAMVHGTMDTKEAVPVRIHSECLTGDLLGSARCDCGEQLHKSLQIAEAKGGIVLYLRQEGRGIGLMNKMRAYIQQDKGLNTIDANLHLGLESDAREYDIAIAMLKDLGVKTIDLMTNNPEKIKAIEESDIVLRSRIPIIIPPGESNKSYLETKKNFMGHLLPL